MFIYKNNYPRWVIKQILTQFEKQQERNNLNSNNNSENSNANDENNFRNENNSQTSENRLSFITLQHKECKVKKLLNHYSFTSISNK